VNVSFLFPAFLWALPLMIAPWILHRLTQNRPRPLPFSSIELIRLSVQTRLYRSRLKNILLLLVRCAMIAALIFLFARPVLRWGGIASTEDRATMVFLIDVSYSMDARAAGVSGLERAVAEARAFLESAGKKDRLGLVAFSDRVEMSVPPSENVAKLREALAGLAATARPTRVAPALELARQMLAAEEAPQKALVVFSDFAENGWRAGASASLDPLVRVLLVETAPLLPNAAVTGVRLRQEASGLAGGFGGRQWGGALESRGWKISVGEGAAAQGRLTPSDGAFQQSFQSGVKPARLVPGEVLLDADGLAMDDRFYFAVTPSPRFSVLVVNGAPGQSPVSDEAYYLAPVLESLSKTGAAVHTIHLTELEREDLSVYDVALLLNPGPAPDTAVNKLAAFVKNGGGLWITAGGNLERAAAAWAPVLPGRVLSANGKRQSLRPAPRGDALSHVLAEDGGFEWGNIAVERFLDVDPAPGVLTLLTTRESNRPLLLYRKGPGGRVAFLTTSVDRDWTNLPAKPVFPVLARELLLALAGRGGTGAGGLLRVDQPFQTDIAERQSQVTVERPDGTLDAAPVTGGRVVYEKTDAPGLYLLRGSAGGDVLDHFVVNVDAESGEGNLTRAKKERVEELLAAPDVVWAAYPEPALKKFQERVRGKDLTPPLALALLLLFALESLLALRWRVEPPARARESVA